jgi:DNA excision repair protein ERCC-2
MTIRYDPSQATLRLSIGDLVSAAFPGSIHMAPMLRSRAALGRRVHETHQTAQQTVDETYRAEVSIRHEIAIDDHTVILQGRVDGVYDDGEVRIIEEIKSLLLPSEDFARVTLAQYPTYEKQLALYLYFMGQTHTGPMRGYLVLINLADNARTTLVVEPDPEAIEAFVIQELRAMLARFKARVERAAQRRSQVVQFPFATMRPQQAEMIDQVRLALQDQSCVLISAPTGIGKTVAALYPALAHALSEGLKLFFVTAKTTQQQLAVDTLHSMVPERGSGSGGDSAPFNAVHLRAKAKSCLNDLFYCHESLCDYAQDYRGKVERSGVVEALLNTAVIGPDLFAVTGQRHRVCPFELSLDVAAEADAIIGDYNYVFDPGAYLRRFFQDGPYDDCILIIDEAHNLYARARDYYSPVLNQRRVRQLMAHCADEPTLLFRDFDTFFRALDDIFPQLYEESLEPPIAEVYTPVSPPLQQMAELRQQLESVMVDYVIYRRRMGHEPGGDLIQDFYYDFQRLCDVLALGGDEFEYLYAHDAENAVFKVLCKDASRFLRQRLEGFHSVIAMSATLTPFAFYQDVLGLPPERTFAVELPSPFPAENRCIVAIPQVSTTYRDRQRDAPKVAEIIETIMAQRQGHYCAFFPSFAYLRQVRSYLQLPPERLLEQMENMSERDRAWMLRQLERDQGEGLLMLAVQGGIFAEGVDYPGDMLIGTIIVGPGLPRYDVEQELIRAYYDEHYDNGFAYAYLYPGMNRVVQSAGRVIRSETDVGMIALVGKRFTYRNYTDCFPSHWYTESPRELVARNYQQRLHRFWQYHASRKASS